MEDRLHLHWEKAIEGLSLPSDVSGRVWKEILSTYRQPERHYHNTDHLIRMLEDLEQYGTEGDDYRSIRLSIFFHDLVYVPGRTDNETLSAEAAYSFLQVAGAGAGTALGRRVADMIEQTAHHHAAVHPGADTMLFLDLDLAILGAPRERYKAYSEAIRKEYHSVPDELFLTGRLGFIERLEALPVLYFTDAFRQNFEEKAKANLGWERIALLQLLSK
ncbi:MAG TPA: hypothetical protein VHK69_07065 [Chitinophagaceae bacterium]|jgi:predicted metal-dependent HD superfamily phosphohydrolase|nr:hypothetical protein [Chitinophagaceae bacterium]